MGPAFEQAAPQEEEEIGEAGEEEEMNVHDAASQGIVSGKSTESHMHDQDCIASHRACC